MLGLPAKCRIGWQDKKLYIWCTRQTIVVGQCTRYASVIGQCIASLILSWKSYGSVILDHASSHASSHASTIFQLKIKGAIHIQWEQLTLNH